jgi:O-antigen/teichoic acid export membrane protein
VNGIETSARNITASTDIKCADESLPVSGPNWLSVLVFWLRKVSFSVLDQGLISGSNFLIGVLLARWLVPEQYGAYALAFSIFLFAAAFHNALLLEPMSVFGSASYGECLPAYIGKLLRLHFFLALFLTGLVVAGIALLHYFTADRALTSALWGVCIAIPLILFFWLCRRAAYIKLAPGLAARGASAYCLVVIFLLLLVQRVGRLSSFTAFLIQSLAATAAAILLLASLRPRPDSQSGPSSLAVVRQHWRYGRWVVATAFVYWLSGNAYYLLVAAFLPMQDVAALRALQNFTLPFGQFISAVSLLLLPWASARFAEEGRVGFQRRIRQITLMFVGAASAYYAVLWLFGGRIMAILYAGRYNEFAYLLTLVAAPVVVQAASQGSAIAVQAMQAPAEVFLAYSVSGTLTILAGVALARYWGLTGALIGILTSSLGYCIVITWRCQKRLSRV